MDEEKAEFFLYAFMMMSILSFSGFVQTLLPLLGADLLLERVVPAVYFLSILALAMSSWHFFRKEERGEGLGALIMVKLRVVKNRIQEAISEDEDLHVDVKDLEEEDWRRIFHEEANR